MKNLFLSTAFALLSVASFAQELTRSLTEPLVCKYEADSIFVFKLSGGCVKENPTLKDVIDFEQFDWELKGAYKGTEVYHTWEESGTYLVCCVKNGRTYKERTAFVINDRYVDFIERSYYGSINDNSKRSDHVNSHLNAEVGTNKGICYVVK